MAQDPESTEDIELSSILVLNVIFRDFQNMWKCVRL